MKAYHNAAILAARKSGKIHIGANVNQAPTDILLSVSSIAENNAIGAVVGVFSTTDPDVGDAFTYSLVSGMGSTDNASFTIDGANLKAGIAFDFETKSSYSVRVRATDAGGLYFEKQFTITVTDVAEYFTIPLISTGNGTGVSTLELTVNSNTTITIDGNAYFYDDSGGTINPNQSRSLTAGAKMTFYLKVLSSSANVRILNGENKVTEFNSWSSSTNAASIAVLLLSDLPSGLTTFGCFGSNTISGALSDLPSGLTYFACSGSNTVSGELSDLPSGLTYFNCQGSNTVSGALSDLPSGLTYFICYGSNTVSGELSDLPSGLTYFDCGGSNTVSGELSDLPSGLTNFICFGSNTISGALSDLPSGLTYFNCKGSNTIKDYISGHNFANLMNRLELVPVVGGGLSSTEVDNLIIDIDNGNTWGGSSRLLKLTGTNAPRTSASDAAVASLISKSVTVTTN